MEGFVLRIAVAACVFELALTSAQAQQSTIQGTKTPWQPVSPKKISLLLNANPPTIRIAAKLKNLRGVKFVSSCNLAGQDGLAGTVAKRLRSWLWACCGNLPH